jgi:HPr kinase/phosphorylase
MNAPLTASRVFSAHEHNLGLTWVAGQSAGDRAILPPADAIPVPPPAIGFLNCIHPPRIQVLGQKELDYLIKLGKNSHADLLQLLFAATPAAIIIADGKSIPEDLRTRAERTQTPLWSARASVHDLIERLSYFLKTTFAPHLSLHGVFMEIVGVGVLLTGASGIGKSELALDLLSRGHRLIADDAPDFHRAEPDVVVGTCPPLLRDFLEVRGLGILNIRAMFGESAVKHSERLQLVVELNKVSEDQLIRLDRLGSSRESMEVLGVPVAKVTLPVTPGRNLAVVVECAARNQILLNQGYDAFEAFSKQQRASMPE